MSYVTDIKIRQLAEEIGRVVSFPSISGPTIVKYGHTITLTASGSKTGFGSEGESIRAYVWELPDGSITEGDTINYQIPNNPSYVGTVYIFKCHAEDTLGNKSRTIEHRVEVTVGGAPDIDEIQWSEDPPHHDNASYILTIIASDPDNDSLTYSVTCSDSNVTIIQDENDSRKFTVTYPDYSADTNVTFTYTGSDGTHNVQQQDVILVRDNIPPSIDDLVCVVAPPHNSS